MNLRLIRTVIIISISFTLLLILILPLGESWNQAENNLDSGWHSIYLIEEMETKILLLPIYILFPLIVFVKNRTFLKVLNGLSLLIASLYFFDGALTLIQPIQDFQPGLGIFFLMTILPQFIILFIINHKM